MDYFSLILIIAVTAGFLMAFSLGANDVANAMATSVASKAVTIRQAMYIAAILNFIGAVFLGAQVTGTIAKGIVSPDVFEDSSIFIIGMLAALLSAGLWVLIASFTALPVSSTHSIIGSIIGFAIAAGAFSDIHWATLGFVILSWITSPFFGALVAYLVFVQIRACILYRKKIMYHALFWAPIWVALTVVIIVLSLCFKTPLGKNFGFSWSHALVLASFVIFIAVLIGKYLQKHLVLDNGEKPTRRVENMFKKMQLSTACFVALSQGANDVANAIGPVAAIVIMMSQMTTENPTSAEVPLWLLCMGGLGIAIGIAVLGKNVMATVGEKITKINNTRGFSVDFSAATTLLIASNLGMPISSTHTTVGAVVGVGLARGLGAVDLRVLYKIFTYWILTLPIAAITSAIIFYILKWCLL